MPGFPRYGSRKRDDILVFDSVEEEGLKVVKRLIGMPGDTLSMENGELFRNGERVNEPYAVHSDPDPLGRPHSARQDAGMAAPPSGPAGPGHLSARPAGVGSDRGAAPIPSS